MTQLAGVDASFLYFETPETPMHVAGFTLFELPDGYEGSFYEDYRAFFESRLHLIPIFGKKLAPALLNLDHPIWVDDDDMNLDYHLRHTTLPKPGTFGAKLHGPPGFWADGRSPRGSRHRDHGRLLGGRAGRAEGSCSAAGASRPGTGVYRTGYEISPQEAPEGGFVGVFRIGVQTAC